tara:strand:+ start:343 stop:495 length:153 start_codon:yes stop_codon:yes gene_type:complete
MPFLIAQPSKLSIAGKRELTRSEMLRLQNNISNEIDNELITGKAIRRQIP